MFSTDEYEAKMTGAFEHFGEELRKIRTGRAHPGMLAGVMVEAYGASMPLNQVANVTAPEAQMLLVTPFNPSDDGRVVRVPVPALTEERRKQLVRQASEKLEEARIALRNIRQDGIKDAKKMKEAKELSEDDLKIIEKEFDRLMNEFQDKLEAAFKDKEKDILTI